jgi:hypothetical protein
MNLILQVPDRPEPRQLLAGEWENVQRLAETVKAYRDTNNPLAVEASLPARTTDGNRLTQLDASTHWQKAWEKVASDAARAGGEHYADGVCWLNHDPALHHLIVAAFVAGATFRTATKPPEA